MKKLHAALSSHPQDPSDPHHRGPLHSHHHHHKTDSHAIARSNSATAVSASEASSATEHGDEGHIVREMSLNSTTGSIGSTSASSHSGKSTGIISVMSRALPSRGGSGSETPVDREAIRQSLYDHEPSDDPVTFAFDALSFVWSTSRKGSKKRLSEPDFEDIRRIIVPKYYHPDFRHNSNGDWESLDTWLDKLEGNRERAKSIRIRLIRSEREGSQRHKSTLRRVSVFLHMENIVHTADSDEEPVHMPVFIIVDIENDKIVADHAVYDMSPFKKSTQLECTIM